MLVKHGTNLILVVGVLLHDSGEDLLASHQVALLDVQISLWLLLSHLLLLTHLHHRVLLLLTHRTAVHLGTTHLLGTTHRGTVHVAAHGAVLTAHLVVVGGTVVGAHATGATLRLLALVATLSGAVVGATSTTHGALTLLLHEVGHGLEEHLEVELELFLVGEVCPLGTLGVLLTELLEIVLVAGSFILELTHFLDLVMVDGKGLVVDGQVLLGGRGLIWLLEAHESVKLLDALTGRVHAEALNLTVLGEKLAEVLLRHGIGETLDVQIASFLGALVLDGLTETFGLTVSPLEGFFDVKLLVVWELHSVDHALTVQLGDGLHGAAGSVFTVLLVLGVEADEGVGSLLVDHVLHALDAAVLAEEGSDILLGVALGEVLGVDVVVDLAEVTLVTGCVLNDLVGFGAALCL